MKEITLRKGSTLRLTNDPAFEANCSEDVLWIDFEDVAKVLKPGNRVFVDDGLLSILVTKIGSNFFLFFIAESLQIMSSTNFSITTLLVITTANLNYLFLHRIVTLF